MEMDERKLRILQAIIDDYILTGIPVGSRTISKKYDMGLSSATIRNEMSDLEELGFLDQPHVSAGRVPSAKAYRLYVDSLLRTGRIPDDSDASIQRMFSGRIRQMEDVIDHAAQVISNLTHYTAVVLSPKSVQPRIQTVQLVPVSSETALVVIVTDLGVEEAGRVCMSGISAYSRGKDGRLCSIRICDYAGFERTIDWSRTPISREEAFAINRVHVFPSFGCA